MAPIHLETVAWAMPAIAAALLPLSPDLANA